MVWNGMEEELNQEVPRLMTEHEYWLIQDKLGARGVKRPSKHKEVPYRGIIKCSECGGTIIPYPKTKRLASGETTTYIYVKCSSKKHCKQPHISDSKLEKQLDSILETVKISQDFHDWFMKWLKNDHHKETNETDVLLQRFDAQIEMQMRRRNTLLDLRIDGEINEKSYSNKKDEINAEIKRLEKERDGVKYQSDDWLKRAEKRIHYALYARDKLENGDFEEKTNVLADLGSNWKKSCC